MQDATSASESVAASLNPNRLTDRLQADMVFNNAEDAARSRGDGEVEVVYPHNGNNVSSNDCQECNLTRL